MANPATQTPHSASLDALDRRDPRWARLRDIVQEKSLKLGDFILSSGRTSKFLFQLRQTTMLPEGQALIGDIVTDYMRAEGLRCVGGLELGAIPITCAISLASFNKGYPVDAFFVRKAAKAHGAQERIDGHITPGGEVLLVDDVATTGKSFQGAVEGVNAEQPGCYFRKALVVIDREEGATEELAKRGIQLVSIFKKSDFNISA
jgi:orotate phosphoribosyltransferase